jgi:2-oxoglutarate dehydrogenase E1 component
MQQVSRPSWGNSGDHIAYDSPMNGDPGSMNLAFLEAMYERYLDDPTSVDEVWRRYFDADRGSIGVGWRSSPRFGAGNGQAANAAISTGGRNMARFAALQHRVDMLIRNYRVRGHIIARVDPLGEPSEMPPELDPAYHGLTEADMNLRFTTEEIAGATNWTLGEIISRLQNTYCRSIGAQFMHIDDLPIRRWLQHRMESTENRCSIEREEQRRILRHLTDAVIFEEFIQRKYIGAKRFSLEGAETLIPLLSVAIEKAAEQGVDEIVIGMAHRGRLNVLSNIVGKSPQQIFREFEDRDPKLNEGRGDVKYHLGHSGNWKAANGQDVHLSLCFNPSHLEFVNPVALGRVRAKQDRSGDEDHSRKLPILIHGDASFAGEGVVQESLLLSELEGYAVGGALEIIVNNQIGFTTSPREARSSRYASDVAKMLQIPILHVNGEDPEAVYQAVCLAMDFRRAFKRNVIIDMYCYRRHGHNEGDEPAFTHPVLYKLIRERKPIREAYLDHLLALGGLTRQDADELVERRRAALEDALSVARSDDYQYPVEAFQGVWEGYVGGPEYAVEDVDTGVASELIRGYLDRLATLPDGFEPHPKLTRGLDQRRAMSTGERPLDWAAGEALAIASLLDEGSPVRLSGQDSARGTFSHRHATYHDMDGEHAYTPLCHISQEQAPFEVINSPLSEVGVLGYEYGYSLDCPNGLVMWEAQFGDFCNVAQVIIDQFITSAEDKWRRLSGLVLLLPHGFEGQGPEHSSARLERFLSLAAEDNIQIVYPTTPAQYFHCLRRQVRRLWRKPMVVMTPKSLLRDPRAVSTIDDCASGRFQRVILDDLDQTPADPDRIILCSGKVYYDLLAKRNDLGREDVPIIRVEQLFPFPDGELRAALSAYPDGTPVLWVQEEPENMGAWRFFRSRFGDRLFDRYPVTGICRPPSASPATGSKKSHQLEQEGLMGEAFAPHLDDEKSGRLRLAAIGGATRGDS